MAKKKKKRKDGDLLMEFFCYHSFENKLQFEVTPLQVLITVLGMCLKK